MRLIVHILKNDVEVQDAARQLVGSRALIVAVTDV